MESVIGIDVSKGAMVVQTLLFENEPNGKQVSLSQTEEGGTLLIATDLSAAISFHPAAINL